MRVVAAGVDEEDALQLIYEGLLRKAASPRSAWNPQRGALSTWVTVAMGGLVINLVEKHRNQTRPVLGRSRDVALGAWPA